MRRTAIYSVLLLVLAIAPPVHAALSCDALSRELKLPHTTITLVAEVPAGAFRPAAAVGGPGGPPANFAALPAFCRVAGTSQPTPDSDIRFEVWMPLSGWNGKFVGGGNGVWAGSIAYGDMVTPLTRGYATAASDVGHQGSPMDGTFLTGHPQKLIDFGHRAEHEMTQAAKATIRAFYGNAPTHSLYVSCSTGGRIGLMEAYR
jgi:feruloyl esterase